ncbi:MAG: alpha-ketoglutarate-dependent dioxygenase AlkB [Acidimicrobiales bacterium]
MSGLTWQHARRPMYDRVVDVPRLIWSHDQPDLGPTELQVVEHLRAVASKLADHYRRPLPRLHANFYRDGDDSVAWHPDSVDCPSDALVAIVSLGAARTFAVRPLGGGSTHRFQLGRGDLLVMGGTTQQYYEHGVPKVAMAAPRISVMFRS